MSHNYVIVFSSEKLGLSNKPLEVEAKEVAQTSKLGNVTINISEEETYKKALEICKFNRKANAERTVIKTILTKAAEIYANSVEDFAVIAVYIASLDEEPNSFSIRQEDFTKYLVNIFPKVEKPLWWSSLGDLFSQLSSPRFNLIYKDIRFLDNCYEISAEI